MPNHVTNIIDFHCSQKVFQEIAEFIRKDDSFFGSVDFNKVLPMPPELDIEAGSRGDQGLKMYKEYLNRLALFTTPEDIRHLRQDYLDKVKDDPEIFELGRRPVRERSKPNPARQSAVCAGKKANGGRNTAGGFLDIG